MAFVSYEFAVFVAGAAAVYWICSGALHLTAGFRAAVLAAASFAFLWFGGGAVSVFWYGLSALSVWYGSLVIDKLREEQPGRSRAVFVSVLVFNLAVLAVFRYINFPGYTMEEICWLTGREWEWEPVQLAGPIAVSFYTLTLAGYLIEVYWGAQEAERNFLRVALFGCFFPQMAVGPIARYDQLSKTLFGTGKVSGKDVREGLYQILWGLFKKLVISERLAVVVNTVYGDTFTYSGSFLVFAAVCFAFQLYTDFGGAIDIACGAARLFGVRLELNFRQPFYSRSVAEFWRRWHITLGGWFKDFLMYPMLKTTLFQNLGSWGKKKFGKKQGKKVPTVAALVVVWFLLGLWHGGKWTFIIGSGLYHAVLMSMSLLLEPAVGRWCRMIRLNREHPLWILVQRIRTFVLVAVGFVFFRSDSLAMAADIFKGMFSGDMQLFCGEGILSLGLTAPDLVVLAVSMAVLFADSARREHAGEENQMGILACAPVCLCLLFVVMIFGYYGRGYDPSAFIYAQF